MPWFTWWNGFHTLKLLSRRLQNNWALKTIALPGISFLKSSFLSGQEQENCTTAWCQPSLERAPEATAMPPLPRTAEHSQFSGKGHDSDVAQQPNVPLQLMLALGLRPGSLPLQAVLRHPPASQLERCFWHQLWKKQQMVPETRCPSSRNE